jgi:hypothetical protein
VVQANSSAEAACAGAPNPGFESSVTSCQQAAGALASHSMHYWHELPCAPQADAAECSMRAML